MTPIAQVIQLAIAALAGMMAQAAIRADWSISTTGNFNPTHPFVRMMTSRMARTEASVPKPVQAVVRVNHRDPTPPLDFTALEWTLDLYENLGPNTTSVISEPLTAKNLSVSDTTVEIFVTTNASSYDASTIDTAPKCNFNWRSYLPEYRHSQAWHIPTVFDLLEILLRTLAECMLCHNHLVSTAYVVNTGIPLAFTAIFGILCGYKKSLGLQRIIAHVKAQLASAEAQTLAYRDELERVNVIVDQAGTEAQDKYNSMETETDAAHTGCVNIYKEVEKLKDEVRVAREAASNSEDWSAKEAERFRKEMEKLKLTISDLEENATNQQQRNAKLNEQNSALEMRRQECEAEMNTKIEEIWELQKLIKLHEEELGGLREALRLSETKLQQEQEAVEAIQHDIDAQLENAVAMAEQDLDDNAIINKTLVDQLEEKHIQNPAHFKAGACEVTREHVSPLSLTALDIVFSDAYKAGKLANSLGDTGPSPQTVYPSSSSYIKEDATKDALDIHDRSRRESPPQEANDREIIHEAEPSASGATPSPISEGTTSNHYDTNSESTKTTEQQGPDSPPATSSVPNAPAGPRGPSLTASGPGWHAWPPRPSNNQSNRNPRPPVTVEPFQVQTQREFRAGGGAPRGRGRGGRRPDSGNYGAGPSTRGNRNDNRRPPPNASVEESWKRQQGS